MSMSVLSALQCLCAFMAYLVMSVLVPSAVFGSRFKKLDITKKFMLYFTIGNFFMMNLVFVLALLHITCRFTLIMSTVVFVVLGYTKNRNISVLQKLREFFDAFNSVITGKLGIKTALFRILAWLLNGIAFIGKKFKEVFIYNIIDWLLIGCFTFLFLKLFAANLVTNYGYPYSDLPVHNYWINYLGKNQIFVAGIYPFGFHCILYYLHEVFLIDTYVLLRVFCVVQTFFVNIMIFTVLKSCCKTKFTPYIGMFGYMALNIFAPHTYERFCGTLPQEFGIIFIFPCAYFAFEFFRERKKELKLEEYIFGNRKERRRKRKEEHLRIKDCRKNKEKTKKNYFRLRIFESYSTLYLAGFAMSFAMTLAVHFYGTMVAGLFAVGIAVGYFFRFIRPKYFFRVVVTCAISVFVAVLPMVVAFAMGTPLQGSLGWGMSILTGGKSDDNSNENEMVTYVTTSSALSEGIFVSADGAVVSADGAVVSADGTFISTDGISVSGTSAGISETALNTTYASINSDENVNRIVSGDVVYCINEVPMKLYFDRVGYVKMTKIHNNGVLNLVKEGNHYFYNMDRLTYKRTFSFYITLLKDNPKKFVNIVAAGVSSCSKSVVEQTQDKIFVDVTKKQVETGYIIALFVLVAGLVYIIFGNPDYGASIVSVVVFMICMALLLTSGIIGLPTLMDSARSSIYFAYMTPLVFALSVDVCIYTVFGWLKWKYVKWIKHAAAFLILIAFVILSYKYDYIKEPVIADYLETNEAVTCLTNIIENEKDFTWTICSANDETRMGEDHGYHYETIEFLRKMEGVGKNAMITIPTDTVYFFIEKTPLDYNVPYEDSGQCISEEGAANYLPSGGGISAYKSRNRWIVMSRMYYWAEEFKKLYPNEMKVYMETEDFICYRIQQNTHRLYNFAIDYGYNTQLYKYLEDGTDDDK